MNRRQRIIISVTGIFIVLLALIGLTYAYFLTRIQGNTNTNSISVTTADLKLVYDDGSDGVIGGVLLEPQPVDSEPFTKTFTVYNDGNVNTDYGVYLIDVINTFVRKDDIKYTMECETDGTLPCGTKTSTTFPSGISEIVTATIEPKKTHTYTFSFTYYDTGTDQSVDMNKKLQAKIQIFGKNNKGLIIPYETNTLAFNILNNGADISVIDSPGNFIGSVMCGMEEAKCVANVAAGCPGTCYEEGTETYTVTNTKTIKTTVNIDNIANGTSWDEELKDFTNDGLFSTEDNYGTSYYYRGPVSNNYVTFSGLCWRIVRIEGDGSIKLTLESQSPCSETMTSNFSIGSTNWGYKKENDGKYIGDYKNSTNGVKNALTTWLTETEEVNEEQVRKNITTKAESLLKNEEWCLGNTTNTYAYNSPYALLGTTATENYTAGTSFYYETGRNLYGKGVTPNARLKCNGETDTSKIGALTADEVVFAGGKAGTSNTNYYLYNKGYNWWTLSRSYFFGTSDGAFIVRNFGYLFGDRVSPDNDVRPAVSLNTGVKITGGNGTKGNSYIINEASLT